MTLTECLKSYGLAEKHLIETLTNHYSIQSLADLRNLLSWGWTPEAREKCFNSLFESREKFERFQELIRFEDMKSK